MRVEDLDHRIGERSANRRARRPVACSAGQPEFGNDMRLGWSVLIIQIRAEPSDHCGYLCRDLQLFAGRYNLCQRTGKVGGMSSVLCQLLERDIRKEEPTDILLIQQFPENGRVPALILCDEYEGSAGAQRRKYFLKRDVETQGGEL
jgi:hypothetical protein